MKRIVHFGFTDLAYSGCVLSGLHTEAAAGRLELEISRHLPPELRRAAGGHENMQMIPLFEAVEGGERVRFCVDNHDKSDFVHPELIREVDFYFKGNHSPDAIAGLPIADTDRDKIRALGAPFAPLRVPWWTHRPPLREVPEVGWTRRGMVRRVRQLRQLPTMDALRRLRDTPKTHDVLFAIRMYRQQHHSSINAFRDEVGRLLIEHPDIDARVTFIRGSRSLVKKLRPDASTPMDHLSRLAASRLGIYVWGAHRCLSFKLFEQLALGLPVSGQPIPQDRANLAGLKGFDEQFVHDEPAALVDAVAAAVNDAKWLRQMAENNASVFDEFLAPEVVVRNLVDTVFGSSSSG